MCCIFNIHFTLAADDICEPDDVTEIDAVDGIDTVDGIVSDHADGIEPVRARFAAFPRLLFF